MLFSKLFRRLRRPEPATRSAPPRSFVPRCEVLEDRTVPSFAGPTELLGVPGGALVKVADIDNDSRPDIVTANGSNLNVAVYWSPGVYTQTFHASLAAPIKDVAVGRINGDAYSDIVVATGETTIYVFLGSGATGGLSGAFSATPIKVSMPKSPHSATQFAMNLTVGDLTGDGKADIVVGAESGTYRTNIPGFGYLNSYQRDSLATVLIGKGEGTFRAGSTVILDLHGVNKSPDPAPLAVPVAIGDVNGDGKPDVAAASYGLYGYPACVGCSPPPELQGDYHVHLLTGDGKGNLLLNPTPWANSGQWEDGGGGPPSLTVRDLNGDGREDIVAAYPVSWSGSSSLHISLSDPSTGQFVTAAYAVSGTPTAVAVGDVTGDGKLDIVVAYANGGGVEVRPGNGDGTFAAPLSFAPAFGFPSMAMADLNGDGDLDLVLMDGFFALQMLNDGVW